VECESFAIVEPDSEAPLFPIDAMSFHLEGGALGLNNLVWLRRSARARPQVRVILAQRGGVHSAGVERALLGVYVFIDFGGQPVYFRNLKPLRHLRTQIERVGVVVCVWVLKQTKVEPALKA